VTNALQEVAGRVDIFLTLPGPYLGKLKRGRSLICARTPSVDKNLVQAEDTQLGGSVSQRNPVRFGPYLLDRQTGELRKHSLRIKLSGQPLEVLLFLLERPGVLVTREELRQRLWTDDVFVDFERSLNSAVKKLRRALNEDPQQPRYIVNSIARSIGRTRDLKGSPPISIPVSIPVSVPVSISISVPVPVSVSIPISSPATGVGCQNL